MSRNNEQSLINRIIAFLKENKNQIKLTAASLVTTVATLVTLTGCRGLKHKNDKDNTSEPVDSNVESLTPNPAGTSEYVIPDVPTEPDIEFDDPSELETNEKVEPTETGSSLETENKAPSDSSSQQEPSTPSKATESDLSKWILAEMEKMPNYNEKLAPKIDDILSLKVNGREGEIKVLSHIEVGTISRNYAQKLNLTFGDNKLDGWNLDDVLSDYDTFTSKAHLGTIENYTELPISANEFSVLLSSTSFRAQKAYFNYTAKDSHADVIILDDQNNAVTYELEYSGKTHSAKAVEADLISFLTTGRTDIFTPVGVTTEDATETTGDLEA